MMLMTSDPGSMKKENIEFRYVSNFNYILPNENPVVNVQDIPIYNSTLEGLKSRGKEEKTTFIQNGRDKTIFLREMNLIFNNTLAPYLFETEIKSLPTFLKMKIIEYNFIIRNFIYFQDISFFEDRVYSKLFREILSELVTNPSLRDDMKIGHNKIQFFLIIYFKYLNIEPNGGDTITEYMALKEKMEGVESFELENDFEASYCMGQVFYYLLQKSATDKSKLNLFTKYILNVHNMDILKTRLIAVLEKYSHNEYLDNNRKFRNLIKNVLAFEFKKSYEDNKIPMYTGYFDSNYLYTPTSLFSWDNVPGNDSNRLLTYLTANRGIGWRGSVEIRKSDDGKAIHIVTDENSAEITIDGDEEKATLKISDGRTHDLNVKTERGKLNIYTSIKEKEKLESE